MCLLCIEFQKEQMTMTMPEARRAFAEMRVSMPPEHAKEVEKMIEEVEKSEEEAEAALGQVAPSGQAAPASIDDVD